MRGDIIKESEILEDIGVITEELLPVFEKFDEKKIKTFSLALFLSEYLAELLKELDNNKEREFIAKRILDW